MEPFDPSKFRMNVGDIAHGYDEGEDQIRALQGKLLSKIDGGVGDDELIFHCDDGERYKLYHSQDCCEQVRIEDITGDLNDLIGAPIELAQASSSTEETHFTAAWLTENEVPESFTWTFYRLATHKGYVTLRFLGDSNGYYSESVDFTRVA